MKKLLGLNVLEAAQKRIEWTFDNFEKIYVSFSGGKDSTVMTHLVMAEAIKRNRKVGILFIDWEVQYQLTIEHVEKIYKMYEEHIIPFWIALPLLTDNACSQYEPEWLSWDKEKKNLWVRDPHPLSITKEKDIPFWYYRMTFEEFVPLFGEWFREGEKCACFVGIRTQESLNRFRSLSNEKKNTFDDKLFTTLVSEDVYNVYPIYDWKTEDIWTYFGKSKKCYNQIYDRFHQAGLTLHQMRVDEPFGDTTRRSLWLYQIIEPQTWAKMVHRMAGANSGSLYSKSTGNMLGNNKVDLPNGHTWESYAKFLLETMPRKTSEHYKGKIAIYLKWYMERGYENGIPDEADNQMDKKKDVPSWKRICRTLLRNDYWCKGLGFAPTKSSNYEKYMDLMKRRRKEWGIFKNVQY